VHTGVWWGTLKEIVYWEEARIDGRIILIRIFRKLDEEGA
jgi:hypothetical protein